MEDIKLLKTLVAVTLLITLVNLGGIFILYSKFNALSGTIGTNKPTDQSSPPTENQPSEQPQKIEFSTDNGVMGSEDAPVTIVEFSDFQCPFCARFPKDTLPQIEQNYIKTGKAKLVFRNFPLAALHQNAQKAAEAVQCAGQQSKFWEFHDKLFANQNALDSTSLKNYAKDLGLDTNKFNDCLDSGKTADEVKKDSSDGIKYGVEGTPTFFINNTKVIGAQPFSVFQQTIEQELNK